MISDIAYSKNTKDVFLQDQTTYPVDLYFSRSILANTTLTSNATIGQYSASVSVVTGITVGCFIYIVSNNINSGRYYFGTVLSISDSTLTFDTPFDYAFQIGDVVTCNTKAMNVNGSVTPVIYNIRGATGSSPIIFDITSITLQCQATSAIDLNKFGNLAALTRGIVIRWKDGEYKNIANVKTNADLARFSVDYKVFEASNPAQGVDGFSWRLTFSGQENHGVVVRLELDETLDIIIQDDLTTLSSLQAIATGHIVSISG